MPMRLISQIKRETAWKQKEQQHTIATIGVRMVVVFWRIICRLQTLCPELLNSINVQHDEVFPTGSLAL